ncbi:MAG: NADH:ubiquinone reductase (Na(+)-transporting) subunit F [Alphaproteobacteria bacterium]|nr:NADH:ubiquinone reductase (Na(+)-transporting) subunit F [Alphaproteobacteria bacterium]
MIDIAIGSGVIVVLILGLTIGLLLARARLVPQEAVVVTVNEGKRIDAARGDRLLGVLHGAGIGIPAACGGSGTCGLCRVTVFGDGAGEVKATEKGVLSATERRNNVRLACQCQLRGSVSVEVPTEILVAEGFACKVASNGMLAPLIRELVLDLPEGREIDFRAGNFMQLTAPAYTLDLGKLDLPHQFEEIWSIAGWRQMHAESPKPVTRAYSIASRPEDAANGKLVFNIRLAVPPAGHEADIHPGIVSSHLFALKPGDALEVSGPFGDFQVQPTGREMVFIGGGVGMAPMRAMVHEQVGLKSDRKMTYYYGARSAADLFYREEFDAIAAANPNFTWTPALSEPAPGDRWTGATGFIHEVVRNAMSSHPAPEDCEYYLCGPPVMISAVLAMLDRIGVEPHSIFNDDFGV